MLGVLNTALLDLLDLVFRVRLYILALLEETFQQWISEKYQEQSVFSMNSQLSPTQVINSVDGQSCSMATFISSPWKLALARFNRIVLVKVYLRRKL